MSRAAPSPWRRTERHLLWMLLLTLLIEAGTAFLRFGLDYQTSRDTSFLARFTFGLRIHHSYLGLLLLACLPLFRRDRWLWPWILRFGVALVASDLVHHFLVLWPATGSPHFDLWYPPRVQPEVLGGGSHCRCFSIFFAPSLLCAFATEAQGRCAKKQRKIDAKKPQHPQNFWLHRPPPA